MAHNIQLVVKDGLKLNPEYNALIDRVSTNIVTKSKLPHVIAEELRNFVLIQCIDSMHCMRKTRCLSHFFAI